MESSRTKRNGNTEDVRAINAYLKTLEHEDYKVYRGMIENKLSLTAINLKNLLINKVPVSGKKMFVPVFEDHNSQIKALVGREYAKGTLDRYETSLKHTKDFLLWE